jgi:colanic acid/amylovoran biosynthesis glycosyltransferase
MPRKLAYIVSRFPHLPETFILREMVEMENLGWPISLFPIVKQNQKVVHADAARWIPRIKTVSFFSTEIVIANWKVFWESPKRFWQILTDVIKENLGDLNFLIRALLIFPKAVWVAKQIRMEKIEHIHAHYASHPALLAWIAHSFTGIPYSITVHAHDIFVRKAMLKRKIWDAQFIVAISNFNRDYLVKELGDWVNDKTHIVHCGILPEAYSNSSLKPVQDRSVFTIINIGSLQPYKGQSILIEACKILSQKNIPIHCLIIGGGELYQQLNELIKSFSLQGMVELIGPKNQEEIAQILPLADCYVQPSIIMPNGKMEGIPLALMEAMICKIPVISSAISGIPELVNHGKTGFLVEPANPTLLAGMIEYVYKNPEIGKEISFSGYNLVDKEYNEHINAVQLSSLFQAN